MDQFTCQLKCQNIGIVKKLLLLLLLFFVFFKYAFFSFCVTQKKIVLVFQVIGKQGPFIAVRIIKHESFIRNLNEKYLT